MMGSTMRLKLVGFACAAIATLSMTPASAQMKGALLYAHCAGIADAAFGGALSRDDHFEMDYFADEAHIFMVLARQDRGDVPVRTLKQLRVEGAAQLFHENATDDSIHAMVQECSDTRQALGREGRWQKAADQ